MTASRAALWSAVTVFSGALSGGHGRPFFVRRIRAIMAAMAQANPTPQTRMTLLKHKRELVKRARKIAARGGFAGFEAVRQQFDEAEAATLKLWATARDQAEIDRLCSDALLKQRPAN